MSVIERLGHGKPNLPPEEPVTSWGTFISKDGQLEIRAFSPHGTIDDFPPLHDSDTVGEMVFYGVPNNPTQSMFAGICAMQEFFAQIDQGRPAPSYLFGNTNRRMAVATQRLGFEISLKDVIFGQEFFRVIGTTNVVRQRLRELLTQPNNRGRNFAEILQRRAAQQKK